MLKLVNRAALLAAVMMSPVSLAAGTLGSVNISGVGLVTGQGVLPPQLPLQFSLAGDSPFSCWSSSTSCVVLLDQVLTPADIGSVFSFDPSTAGFPAAAGFLTDGILDMWGLSLTGVQGGIGVSDSSMLPPGSAPDFIGYAVTEIDLTLNDLVFSQVQLPVSNNPITFGTFTQATLDITITAQGAPTPEPRSTLMLLAILLSMILHWRRTHRSTIRCRRRATIGSVFPPLLP
jgi:hypothetical protein